jgi:hypothetical protein
MKLTKKQLEKRLKLINEDIIKIIEFIDDNKPKVNNDGCTINTYITYGAIRRRRLLALKLMRSTKFDYSRIFLRSTKPPLLYSTC